MNNTKYIFLGLVMVSSINVFSAYFTAKTVADFDRFVDAHPYTVVAFYHDEKDIASDQKEMEQLKQFKSVFTRVSNNPAHKNIGFMAMNVAFGNDGAIIKQRYNVTGYPSYIILRGKRQDSPFSLFLQAKGYLSDDVSQEQLEEFIRNTVKR